MMRLIKLLAAVEDRNPTLVIMSQDTYHRLVRREIKIAEKAGLSLDPVVYRLVLDNEVGDTRFIFTRNPGEPTRFVYDCEVIRDEDI